MTDNFEASILLVKNGLSISNVLCSEPTLSVHRLCYVTGFVQRELIPEMINLIRIPPDIQHIQQYILKVALVSYGNGWIYICPPDDPEDSTDAVVMQVDLHGQHNVEPGIVVNDVSEQSSAGSTAHTTVPWWGTFVNNSKAAKAVMKHMMFWANIGRGSSSMKHLKNPRVAVPSYLGGALS
ncbi:hypothetical protein L2E82_11441 [Cichorium intybus]|uniref:Uncharacterized protein n=1 Tax=Cichorium intybus TaxID=13427 RepID=A0ACB9GEA9_CICIN|nr:hypothetical protein L2E82_11441 [Cichorium intybus]